MINWGGTHKNRKENMNLIYAFKVRPVMFYFCEVSLQRSLHFCKVSTQPEHDRLHCTYWGQLLVCLVWFSIKYSVQLAALSLDADQVSTFLSICCLTLSSINTPNCENYVSQVLWIQFTIPLGCYRINFTERFRSYECVDLIARNDHKRLKISNGILYTGAHYRKRWLTLKCEWFL